jgi:hypothetical protein
LYASLRVNPQKALAVNARMMVGLGPARVRLRQIDNGHTSFFSTRSEEPVIPSRHPPKPPPGPDDWRQETQQRSPSCVLGQRRHGTKSRPSTNQSLQDRSWKPSRASGSNTGYSTTRDYEELAMNICPLLLLLFPVANISSDSRTIFQLKGESSRLRLVLVRRASSPALE